MSHSQHVAKLRALTSELDKVVIGYDHIKQQVVVVLLAGGNALLRAVPGTGKTTLINTLQRAIENCQASRIQLTPDLKPSDLIGGRIWDPGLKQFVTSWGPMVENNHKPTNIVLADEVNRTTPKTLSAMLQSAQEHTVTIGDETRAMEDLFMICATMNPVEQEGTYALPEAMTDRFAVLLDMGYLTRAQEIQMLKNHMRSRGKSINNVQQVVSKEDLLAMRKLVLDIGENISDAVYEYIVDLVRATRPVDERFDEVHGVDAEKLRSSIMYGASPRAEIWIASLAAANAFYLGDEVVTLDHVKNVSSDVINHRVILNPAAARRVKLQTDIIDPLFERVAVTGGNLAKK